MQFCAEVRTEPYIAVNTGLGSVQEAADLALRTVPGALPRRATTTPVGPTIARNSPSATVKLI